MTLYREITDEERRTWSASRFQCLNVVPVDGPVYQINKDKNRTGPPRMFDGIACWKNGVYVGRLVEIGGDDE